MNKTKMNIEDLDALVKVRDAMLGLSLPNLQPEALKAVGRLEGEDFKKAIVKIANDEDTMNACRDYITGVTCLLTGPVEAALASMGYINLERSTLIKLGKECGKEFRSHLSNAARNDRDAINWIQKKITEYGAGVSEFQRTNNPAQGNMGRHDHNQPPVRNNTSTQASKPTNTPVNRSDNNRYHDKYPSTPKSTVGQGSDENNDKEFFSMTFYGGKSALCFNAVDKDGEHSINLDGGNKKPGQEDGGRAIDWKDKVVFGFSADELIEFAWVLMGVSQSCEFSGHGPLHDKSFQFKRQGTGFFGSVSAKDKGSRAVPLSHAAGARLMFLVSRQLQKNYPSMTVSEVLNMLKMMANKAVSA